MPQHLDIRVALIILQADVVARPIALDQRFFEDQRLDLVFFNDEINIADMLAQVDGFQAGFGAGVEITAHAVAQFDRLANINDRPVFVFHQVDAGLHRQIF